MTKISTLLMSRMNYKTKIFLYISLSIFAISVLVSSVYFLNINNTMEKQTIKANSDMVKIFRNATEIMLKDLDRTVMQVSLNPTINNFLTLYNSGDMEFVEVINFIKIAGNAFIYNKYINSCYIYYYEDGTIIQPIEGRVTSISIMRYAAENNKYIADDLDLLDGTKLIYTDNTPKNGFNIYSINTKSGGDVLSAVRQVVSGVKKNDALIIITIDQTYFDDMLKYININEKSNVYIIDGNGNAISRKNKSIPEFLELSGSKNVLKKMSAASGNFEEEIDNEKVLISYVTSEQFGWKFIYTIPLEEIYKKVSYTKVYLVFLSILCLLPGIGISFILSGKLYSPITRILKAINAGNNSKVVDEISYISQNITRLVSKNNNLEELLESSIPLMKNALLLRVLKNELSPNESIWEKLHYYGARIKEGSLYIVCAIAIDYYDMLSEKYSELQINMLHLRQMELVFSHAGKYPEINIETVKTDTNELVILTSIEMLDYLAAASVFKNFIYGVHDSITGEQKVSVTIGVGSIYDSISKVPVSFTEAKSSLAYKVILGNNCIIMFNDIPEVKGWYYQYPFDIERKVLSCVKEMDRDKLAEELKSFFNYIHKSISDYIGARYAFVHLLNSTLKYCSEITIDINHIIDREGDLYKDLMAKESLGEIHEWFRAFYLRIVEYIEEKRDNRLEMIISDVCAYINAHYSSSEIGLEQLAEQMHFSVSYLSKIFKDSTGTSIKEYITQIRINEAKRLLETTSIKVKDIGEQVGYINTQSFTNIFKKYQGETPKEYHDRVYKRV